VVHWRLGGVAVAGIMGSFPLIAPITSARPEGALFE